MPYDKQNCSKFSEAEILQSRFSDYDNKTRNY